MRLYTAAIPKQTMNTFFAMIVAFVLVVQGTIGALTVHAATISSFNELVSKLTTEVQNRTKQITSAESTLKSSNGLPTDAKDVFTKAVSAAKAAVTDISSKIPGLKTLQQAQDLAKKFDSQFENFAVANVQAQTAGSTSAQQQVQQQLKSSASGLLSVLEVDKADGKDVTAQQDQLVQINKLIESVSATIQSVISLILALASGNFSAAQTIFQTILGQLTQNLQTILTAQSGLQALTSLAGGGSGSGGMFNINLGSGANK